MSVGSHLTLNAIAAMAENRVIGKNGGLPWHLPEDLRIFKRQTTGCPVVMGRATWESLPIKPLPRRNNIVISTTLDPEELPHGVDLYKSIPDFTESGRSGVAWLIGGASLYAQLLPSCSELFLSYVYGEPDGDAYFPQFEHLFALDQVLSKHEGFELRRYSRRI